jgi:hypothetical protein
MQIRKQDGFGSIESLLLLVIVCIVGFTGWFVWMSKNNTNKLLASTDKVSNLTQKTATTKNPATAIVFSGPKFIGTVTKDGCATTNLPIGDVGCSIIVGSITVDVLEGNAGSTQPWGSRIGINNIKDNLVGKKVEVYGHQINPNHYDLSGSSSYYVKLLD